MWLRDTGIQFGLKNWNKYNLLTKLSSRIAAALVLFPPCWQREGNFPAWKREPGNVGSGLRTSALLSQRNKEKEKEKKNSFLFVWCSDKKLKCDGRMRRRLWSSPWSFSSDDVVFASHRGGKQQKSQHLISRIYIYPAAKQPTWRFP